MFHDAIVPPDDFIASCKIPISDLMDIKDEANSVHDISVSFVTSNKDDLVIEHLAKYIILQGYTPQEGCN